MHYNIKKMKQYLSMLDDILRSAETRESNFGMGFTTSAEVVIKASGLRLEAIRVIAREQGVEIEDTTCRCINESLLAALADAHVRKMRAYFNNAKRHFDQLAGDELATYIDFCRTFNKRQSPENTAQSWKDIDADAIREQFLQKVYELTPSAFKRFSLSGFAIEKLFASLSFESCDYLGKSTDSYEYKQRSDVVDRILSSYLFYERPAKTRPAPIDIRLAVWRITLSARYHIFTSEDDDHQQDTINSVIIYRAPAMAA